MPVLYGRMFRTLLIPVALSSETDRIVDRAALLPMASDARLTLLHVLPKLLSRAAKARAAQDARKKIALLARRLARKVSAPAGIDEVVVDGNPANEIAKHARSLEVELVVMGRGSGRAVRDAFLGSTAERVIRGGHVSALVVRVPPRAPYRRPLLALDLDDAAPEVLAVAQRVLGPALPPLTIVHAFDALYPGMIYPSLSPADARRYLEPYRRRAIAQVTALVTRTLADVDPDPPQGSPPRWRAYVREGSPRSIVARLVEKTGADLLVLGTRGHRGVAQAFLGTVAGDLLREVSCDVLVVPPRRSGYRARGA